MVIFQTHTEPDSSRLNNVWTIPQSALSCRRTWFDACGVGPSEAIVRILVAANYATT